MSQRFVPSFLQAVLSAGFARLLSAGRFRRQAPHNALLPNPEIP